VNVENLRCDGLRLDRFANAVILTTQHICGHLCTTTTISHGSLTTVHGFEQLQLNQKLVLLTRNEDLDDQRVEWG
jgi:hypothetical protein